MTEINSEDNKALYEAVNEATARSKRLEYKFILHMHPSESDIVTEDNLRQIIKSANMSIRRYGGEFVRK